MIDQDLLSEFQLALLEPVDGGQSWPSEVWSRDEALEAVNSTVRMLVRETNLVVTRTELAVLAGALSVTLPDDWLASAAMVWRDTATGVRTPLGPVDSFESDLALPGWETTQNTPIGWADLDTATLTLRLVPTPALPGTLELLYIPVPTAVNGNGMDLPIPDDYLGGVKYGGLGWLLRKVGRLQDPERAAYCDQRYEMTRLAAEIILGGWA